MANTAFVKTQWFFFLFAECSERRSGKTTVFSFVCGFVQGIYVCGNKTICESCKSALSGRAADERT